MSLINEALKRASQSDRNRPRPAETRARMESVADPREPSLSLALWGGIVLALGLAGWLFWHLWNTGHPAAPAAVQPVAAAAPEPAPAQVVSQTVPPPVAAPPPAPAPAATPAEQAWPADLKVMGIFFSKSNPRALISGRTVGPGDQIDGIRVTGIATDRVWVEWNGQVKELMMQ
jgi:hypothetical protein